MNGTDTIEIKLTLYRREKALFAGAAKRAGLTIEKFIEDIVSIAVHRQADMPATAGERKRSPQRPAPMMLPSLPAVPLMHDRKEGASAESPQKMVSFWHRNVALAPWFDAAKEHVIVAILNSRFHVSAYSLVSIGTVNECLAHPRDILRPVIGCCGYAFIVMHNHPSGVSDPSRQDHALTERIKKAAEIMQLLFLDHIIIGAGRDYFAFSEIKGGSLLANPRRKRATSPALRNIRMDKQIVIKLSKNQRAEMHAKFGRCDLSWFAKHASDSQLFQLGGATPICFRSCGHTETLVAAVDASPDYDGAWARRIVLREMRKRGIAA